MTRWHPSLDLACLLEALSQEILAANDEEVRQTSGLQGWSIANTALEVREVIKAAQGEPNGRLDRNDNLSEPEARLRLSRGDRSSSHHQRH